MPEERIASMVGLNATHDPQRRSWLESANDPRTDFPIQNLPFGIFRNNDGVLRGGVAIGDQILDLVHAADSGLFSGRAAEAAAAAAGPVLNPLMQLGIGTISALRRAIGDLFDVEHRDSTGRLAVGACLVPMRFVAMHVPVAIGAFTGFFGSAEHARRMGRATLPRAFKHVPLASNARANSIVTSGTRVVRPKGTFARGEGVAFGPEPALDFELTVGAFTGRGSERGTPIPLDDAEGHLFGLCLLNDWSARGMQLFESTPLGPFLGKSFATTISPWIVTAEALLPYRCAMPAREDGDPASEHLTSETNTGHGAFAIELEALVQTAKMRTNGFEPALIATTAFRDMYWTFAQMLAHQTSNGSALETGDLLGSGATSGASPERRACFAELTTRGTDPLRLPNGELRAWLEDGDEVIFRAHAAAPDYARIGFGECSGRIAPATPNAVRREG